MNVNEVKIEALKLALEHIKSNKHGPSAGVGADAVVEVALIFEKFLISKSKETGQ